MPRLGRVRYLKPIVQAPAGEHLLSQPHGRDATRAAERLAGTDDAAALYVVTKAQYRARVSHRAGCIAGLVWLAPLAEDAALPVFATEHGPRFAWPLAATLLAEGPDLKQLVHQAYGERFTTAWASLRGSMTGGRLFPLDSERYAPLSRVLTAHYRPLVTGALALVPASA